MASRTILLAASALAAFGVGLAVEPDPTRWTAETGPLAPADARVGRPLTPVSVAGVARRTARRVVRRSTIYVATLPRGCATVVIGGTGYWQCGATYYQPWQGQYVVVYVE